MTLRVILSVMLPLVASLGCSDSAGPGETNPQRIVLFACCDSSLPAGSPGIFAIGLESDASLKLLNASIPFVYSNYMSPPWTSSDGKTIRVVGWNPTTAGTSLYMLDADGTLLSAGPFPNPGYPFARLSPNGKRVAWFYAGSLYLSNQDSTDVTKVFIDSRAQFSEPGWSTNGEWVAFAVRWAGATEDEIWKLRVSDGLRIRLSHSAGWKSDVAWSRNGLWLAFQTGSEIHRLRTDGSGSEVVVFGAAVGVGSAHRPAWGPGDSLIVFTIERSTSWLWDVVVVRPDGSGSRTVLTGFDDVTPAWGN